MDYRHFPETRSANANEPSASLARPLPTFSQSVFSPYRFCLVDQVDAVRPAYASMAET